MVGYALNSPSGTYRMYNPKTNVVIETNSVGWKDFNRFEDESVTKLKNEFHEPKSGGTMTVDDDDDSDDDVTHTNDIGQSPSATPPASDEPSTMPSRRVTRSTTAASCAAATNPVPNLNVTDDTLSPAAPGLDAPTDQPTPTPNFTVTGNTEPT